MRYLLLSLTLAACGASDYGLQPIDTTSGDLGPQLAALGRAIEGSRIVLLGENGHGVADFTELKVEVVKWLHEDHGFDVIAFESGYFECGEAWNRIDSLGARGALYQCLRYPFQHGELLPLFEYLEARKDSAHSLELAGMDIQAQGFDSQLRSLRIHDWVSPSDRTLARRLAAVDTALFQSEQHGGQGDAVYAWALAHGDSARTLYARGAQTLSGHEEWVLRLSRGWIDRLAIRGLAESDGVGRPARYYEIRDEWMANAIEALADSLDGPRKVVVWLHNDHARYGTFEFGVGPVRSTGGYLRTRYGPEVFSIGLFMGQGSIADNGRQIREVGSPPAGGVEDLLSASEAPASYLLLRNNPRTEIREWASEDRAYLRMGVDSLSLVPGDEFDALMFVDRVRPPNYEIPRQ